MSNLDTSMAFLSDPYFYYMLILGCLAMLPRARYTADRMLALSPDEAQRIKPNLPQRACLFIPGLCVFACIVMFGYLSGAVTLLVVFLLVYVGLVMILKGPSPR